MVKKVKQFRSVIYQLIGLNKLEMDQFNALENMHSPERNSIKALQTSPGHLYSSNNNKNQEKGLSLSSPTKIQFISHDTNNNNYSNSSTTTPNSKAAEIFVNDFVKGNDV